MKNVSKFATEYEKLYEKIDNIILELERKQIEEGVGVWKESEQWFI